MIIPSKFWELGKQANQASIKPFTKILLIAILSLEDGYSRLFLLFPPSRITLDFASELTIHLRIVKSYAY
jgi:hypothetical protein